MAKPFTLSQHEETKAEMRPLMTEELKQISGGMYLSAGIWTVEYCGPVGGDLEFDQEQDDPD